MLNSVVLLLSFCGAVLAKEICVVENAGNTTPTGTYSTSVPLDVVTLSPSQIQSQIQVPANACDLKGLGAHQIGVKAVFCDDPYGSADISADMYTVTATRNHQHPHQNYARLYITVYCDAVYWSTVQPPPLLAIRV